MTRYAKEKGILEVSTLTNGLRLNPEQFEEMVDAGLDWLTISFDGMGETYERIRKPAKFDDAVEKIRQYDAIKKRRGTQKPVQNTKLSGRRFPKIRNRFMTFF